MGTFVVFALGFGLPLVVLSVLARTRQDSVVRFLARHHRKIEIVSGVLLIAAGSWDLWLNWESILHHVRLVGQDRGTQASPASRALAHSERSRPGTRSASWAMSGA